MAQGGGLGSFSALPQDCVSIIISLTSPKDACRFSVISTGFQLAAQSDFVWDKFLPSDYQEIISRSVSPVEFTSKKALYFHLCHSPILLDGGTKSFALDKLSGKKCYMLAARELSITWENTPHYWSWTPLPQSRFLEVAHLRQVCWLDIQGKIQTRMLSPNTTYATYLVYLIAEESYGLEGIPVKVSVRFVEKGGAGSDARIVYFQPTMTMNVPEQNEQFPRARGDGWMEIEIGEFFNNQDDDDKVNMQVREVEVLNWKCGLVVQGIELRPKEGT